jgi:hypothetical protein
MDNDTVRYSIDFDKDLYRRFKVEAAKRDVYMADVLRGLIKLWLDGKVTVEEQTDES